MSVHKKVDVADKLGVNRFRTDETHSHIVVDKEYPNKDEIQKLTQACPAGLYKEGPNGELFFEYLGCLECGTCRVLCGGKVIKDWNYPKGSLGVEYRYS